MATTTTVDSLFAELERYAGEEYDSTDETQVQALTDILNNAVEEALLEMYPWGYKDETAATAKCIALYGTSVILKIAQYNFDKAGVMGVVNHSESGVYQTYENAFTPDSLLRKIIPVSKVAK